jgi:flavin-dependent thymidylate synthase
MKVTLISSTPDAVELLIFTKNTRLTMSPAALEEIKAWPWERKLSELEYMANTIPSSWEFVDYTFMIEGVTRAFTHQFVRSRHWSFAQQTHRVLDVSTGKGWEYGIGPSIMNNPFAKEKYENGMAYIDDLYKELIHGAGVTIEDARGILPTNILTNIVGKCTMRGFVELIYKRSGPRVQKEYRDVLAAMKASVLEAHPWISLFIDRTFDKAAADLDEEINGITDENKRIRMMKLADQMRAKQ